MYLCVADAFFVSPAFALQVGPYSAPDVERLVIYTVGLVVGALLLYILLRGPSPRRGRRRGTKGAAGGFVASDSYHDHVGEGSNGSSSGGGWFGDGGGGGWGGGGGDGGGGGG